MKDETSFSFVKDDEKLAMRYSGQDFLLQEIPLHVYIQLSLTEFFKVNRETSMKYAAVTVWSFALKHAGNVSGRHT